MSVYSISELNKYLKTLLSFDQVLQDVWVKGQIGTFTKAPSGHSYFTLRDSNSTINCVMFQGTFSGVNELETGMSVVAHGRIAIYEPRGQLQMIIDVIQPEGVGLLQIQFDQMKEKLNKDGLFDESRKRLIPKFPNRIAVITSPTGAVWQDIQNVVNRRYPVVELILIPSIVQGDTATKSLIHAFEILNNLKDVDVVIVARGGGSLEDIWPFNEELVARAVYASSVPVISAIGHETDVTIIDMVADLRAPTPSIAAEIVVPDKEELLESVANNGSKLLFYVEALIQRNRIYLESFPDKLEKSIPDFDFLRIKIDDCLNAIIKQFGYDVVMKKTKTQSLLERLNSLNPNDVLRRGFAIVQNKKNDKIIQDSNEIKSGDLINITLNKGNLDAEVLSNKSTKNID